MTNATTTLNATLETVRNQAWRLWQEARKAEQAAWELYRGEDFDHQAAWQKSREIKRGTETAYDQLQRACRAAGITSKAEDSDV